MKDLDTHILFGYNILNLIFIQEVAYALAGIGRDVS